MGMARHSNHDKSAQWNERKDTVLRKEWGHLSLGELAERLCCTKNTVSAHAVRLKLPPLKVPNVKQA